MHRYGLVFACLFSSAGGSGAASPNPADLVAPPEVQVKVRALVRRLGSEEFAEREDAQKQLAGLGRHARPALLAGATTNPNPEIRLRCAELLPAASALDLRARLDAFLADTKGEYEHDLPGWHTFRAVVCREWAVAGRVVWADQSLAQAAREVFAELLVAPANRRVLLAVDGSRTDLIDLVMDRRQEFTRPRFRRGADAEAPRRDPTLADAAVLLFADSRVGSQFLPRRGSAGSLMSASGFTSAARGTDEKSRVYRAIAAAWLDSRNEPREMAQAMSIASNLDLTDQMCRLAARLLVAPGVNSYSRGRAASNLVAYGGKEHIRLLEPATADEGVVYTGRAAVGAGDTSEEEGYEIQVRDLALAASLVLADQKPADYGFTDRSAGTPADKQSFAYTRYYFADDAARKAAFVKWDAWRRTRADN